MTWVWAPITMQVNFRSGGNVCKWHPWPQFCLASPAGGTPETGGPPALWKVRKLCALFF